ncbi:MAG TPA: TadE/TadG family type IV pilus assembly protein [Chloroflexota bacterium]|nr:TadE/TadG family type IV pilus assembly protein [Chloroflexota bacterium]
MDKRRHLLRRERGQSLVEFAFVLLAFMTLCMCVVDLGRGILFYNMLSNAVREGARYGVISTNTSANICTTVINAMLAPGTAGCSDATKDLNVVVQQGVCVDDDPGIDGTKEIGSEVSVSATYRFVLITPLIGTLTGNPITLTAASTMYNENWGPSIGGCP